MNEAARDAITEVQIGTQSPFIHLLKIYYEGWENWQKSFILHLNHSQGTFFMHLEDSYSVSCFFIYSTMFSSPSREAC